MIHTEADVMEPRVWAGTTPTANAQRSEVTVGRETMDFTDAAVFLLILAKN